MPSIIRPPWRARCAPPSFVRRLVFAIAGAMAATPLPAQRDTTVQGSIYQRPFIASSERTAIGGYVEANGHYRVDDGITDGLSMELRRFNIFLYSTIGSRLRFLSELEFEHGTREIALETAIVDLRVNPSLVVRAGILLPPIGAFNQNHDGPRWEFVDRPLVSTTIIPSTLSEIGFGVNGRLSRRGGASLTYDAYLTNGLGEGVVLNETGRTDLASGKREEQFAGDNNGSPAFSGRVALQRGRWGEFGVSYYGAVYNAFRVDGEEVDERRRVDLTAVDWSTTLPGSISLRGEAGYARIDIPASLDELLGDTQWGGHLDLVAPVWRVAGGPLRGAPVNAALRLEYVDHNVGSFAVTGRPRGDEIRAVVPGVSFRPAAGTVFKLNYRREWSRDLLRNPTARSGVWQVGVASYF